MQKILNVPYENKFLSCINVNQIYQFVGVGLSPKSWRSVRLLPHCDVEDTYNDQVEACTYRYERKFNGHGMVYNNFIFPS